MAPKMQIQNDKPPTGLEVSLQKATKFHTIKQHHLLKTLCMLCGSVHQAAAAHQLIKHIIPCCCCVTLKATLKIFKCISSGLDFYQTWEVWVILDNAYVIYNLKFHGEWLKFTIAPQTCPWVKPQKASELIMAKFRLTKYRGDVENWCLAPFQGLNMRFPAC